MEKLSVDMAQLRRQHWSAAETQNAAVVAEFVELLMNRHDFDEVRRRFSSSAYVQHNHSMRDGLEGVLDTVTGLVKRYPDYGYDVKTVLVDGDMVIFHSHVTLRAKDRGNDRRGFNIADRWRVADGQIVEHWDSIQPMDLLARIYMLFTGGRVANSNGTY